MPCPQRKLFIERIASTEPLSTISEKKKHFSEQPGLSIKTHKYYN